MNFPDTINPWHYIIFVKLKIIECYFEVNLSNLFPVNVSSYMVYTYVVSPILTGFIVPLNKLMSFKL